MNEAWAAIIAALITAIATGIFARFDDIMSILRRPHRNLTGVWEIESKWGTDGSWMGDYEIEFTQIGSKVKGKMRAIKLWEENKRLHRYDWSGKIVGEYLMYECYCTDPNIFKISAGLLYIHVNGDEMSGSFVGNSGGEKPYRTWIASTRLKRKR